MFDEEMEVQQKPEKKGFFKKMLEGLGNTRKNIMSGVENVLSVFTKIDEELFEELEESLIMADIGVNTAAEITEALRSRVKAERVTEVSAIKELLVDEITKLLVNGDEPLELKGPAVVLIIGVNGVGKTTTIAKLANVFKNEGKSVLIAAADTFRAAAIDQLEVWCKRAGVEIIKQQAGSDPAAVVYDAVNAAKSRGTDILLCDTAGRLHNKKNLMEELKKIYRIVAQQYEASTMEVLLVLDATTGQNALSQAKLFKEAADITGLILTKLDGTAKGGVVIAIKNELKIPIRFIGVGEGINDLQQFNALEFARALFDKEEEEVQE